MRDRFRPYRRLAQMAVVLALAACSIPSIEERRVTALGVANPNGFTPSTIVAGGFQQAAFLKLGRPGTFVRVYLEGDGFAWITPTQISDDPTPIDPLVLRLATSDDAPNVAYLARPCQYTRRTDPRCAPIYWAGTRKFGEEIVASVDAAVSEIKRRAGADRVELVGYSGGGAIAVLVAARRTDVASIRTIGGNLDHVWLHAHHGVSQLPGSLNAIDSAARTARIPQTHFSGESDGVVPPEVARRYVRASGAGACVRQRIVPGATHTARWTELWRGLLAETPACP
ncbi:MAG: alpha/beta hydrolase [Proteobacteria bacterium]|nr:alpha/beta hydrolase [Pseudomonadota bacterium]